ncbi:MAG: LysR family transcriptional regulator [Synechococcales cyanobacterium CRU_2_2]|nr:LysR family transcriptional regulator [Synechococcales cyanobacterium CRU_2_2]
MNFQALSTVELRQICYFLTIVDTGYSFSRAAERLQIEQPPLSQRIRALEKRMNVQLFDRTRRPVQLTAAGKVFEREARLALMQIETAIAQAQKMHQGEIGHLSIGIASSAANGILPELIRRFCDRYPHVHLELHELTAAQQREALRDTEFSSRHNRSIDMGIEVFLADVLQDVNLEHRFLQAESLVAALPEAHSLAGSGQIALKDLVEQSLILPDLQAFPFYETFWSSAPHPVFSPKY